MATALLRQSSPRPGPELDLIDRALSCGLPIGYRGEKILLREPELPTGRPDVVVIFPRTQASLPRTPLDTQHLKVLHEIWASSGLHESALQIALGLTSRKLSNILSKLEQAEVIIRRGNFISSRSIDSVFGIRGIIAIEAKIKNWKAAIRQARTNLWFASESYILLPKRRDWGELVRHARRSGIGILCQIEEEVRQVAPALRAQIPSSYGSWLFTELVNRWSAENARFS